MYLFDNTDLAFVQIKNRFVEIVFCDCHGMITAPMASIRASTVYNRLLDAGVSPSYIGTDYDRPQIQIPWTFADASRQTLLFTGAENAQNGIEHA